MYDPSRATPRTKEQASKSDGFLSLAQSSNTQKGHELHTFAAFLALRTLRLACMKLSLDLVDVDFLVVVATAVSVFVELDVVVYTFVAVSISLRLACILQYRAAEKKRQHTYPSR
jgi:hypothetical protein